MLDDPNNEKLYFLGISGSLRRASLHSGLLRAVRALCPPHVTMDIADLATIPLYNSDIDGSTQPAGVVRLKDQINRADLLIIASPEYNGSYSGALKNAIDWATRPVSHSSMAGKHAVLMTAAGRNGGVRGLLSLRQLLNATNTDAMLRPEFALALARDKFDTNGDVNDDDLRHDIETYLEKSNEWLARQTAWRRNPALIA